MPATDTLGVLARLSATRCDRDAVGTLFDLAAHVDGREVVVPLRRPQEVVDALLAFTAATCGPTGPG